MYGQSGIVRDLGDGRIEKIEAFKSDYMLENWFAYQMHVVAPEHFTKLHSCEILTDYKLPKMDIPDKLRKRLTKSKKIIRRVYDKIDYTLTEGIDTDKEVYSIESMINVCRICIIMREYGWSHNDLHTSNIGMRDGNFVLIDYGSVSNTHLPGSKPSENEGPLVDYEWLIIWVASLSGIDHHWARWLPELRDKCPRHKYKNVIGRNAEFWAFLATSPKIWEKVTGISSRLFVGPDILDIYLKNYGNFRALLEDLLEYQLIN